MEIFFFCPYLIVRLLQKCMACSAVFLLNEQAASMKEKGWTHREKERIQPIRTISYVSVLVKLKLTKLNLWSPEPIGNHPEQMFFFVVTAVFAPLCFAWSQTISILDWLWCPFSLIVAILFVQASHVVQFRVENFIMKYSIVPFDCCNQNILFDS